MAGMGTLKLEITGVDELISALGKLKEEAIAEIQSGLVQGGDELLRLANKEVPIKEGTLLNSGSVDTARLTSANEVDVGYNTPYAARLHEHPEYKFKNGRKGRYLKDPVDRNGEVIAEYIAAKLKSKFQ